MATISLGTWTALVVAAFLTAIISGAFGAIGGTLLLSVLTLLVPYSILIPLHGVVQLMSNSSRAFMLRKSIKKNLFWPYFWGVPPGAALAAWWLKDLSSPVLPYFLISFLLFYSVFKPKRLPAIQLRAGAFFFVGFFAGALGMTVGAVGAFLAPFFLRPDLDKEEMVATQAAAQIITHLVKIPAFLWIGFNYLEHWQLIAVLGVAVVTGTSVGVKILDKLPQARFLMIFKGIMIILALRLFYLAASGL